LALRSPFHLLLVDAVILVVTLAGPAGHAAQVVEAVAQGAEEALLLGCKGGVCEKGGETGEPGSGICKPEREREAQHAARLAARGPEAAEQGRRQSPSGVGVAGVARR
jgi:hypothetical protein